MNEISCFFNSYLNENIKFVTTNLNLKNGKFKSRKMGVENRRR